jgi:hypothetical protein
LTPMISSARVSEEDDSVDEGGDLQYDCSNAKTFFDEDIELLDESEFVESDIDTSHTVTPQ